MQRQYLFDMFLSYKCIAATIPPFIVSAAPMHSLPKLRHSGTTAWDRGNLGRFQVPTRTTSSPLVLFDSRLRYPGVRSDSDMHTLGYKYVFSDDVSVVNVFQNLQF